MGIKHKRDLEEAKDIVNKDISTATLSIVDNTTEASKLFEENYLIALKVLKKVLTNNKENTHFKIQAAKTIIDAKAKKDLLQAAMSKVDNKNQSGATYNLIINTQKQTISVEKKQEVLDVEKVETINDIDDIIKEAEEKENEV